MRTTRLRPVHQSDDEPLIVLGRKVRPTCQHLGRHRGSSCGHGNSASPSRAAVWFSRTSLPRRYSSRSRRPDRWRAFTSGLRRRPVLGVCCDQVLRAGVADQPADDGNLAMITQVRRGLLPGPQSADWKHCMNHDPNGATWGEGVTPARREEARCVGEHGNERLARPPGRGLQRRGRLRGRPRKCRTAK